MGSLVRSTVRDLFFTLYGSNVRFNGHVFRDTDGSFIAYTVLVKLMHYRYCAINGISKTDHAPTAAAAKAEHIRIMANTV